MAAQTQQKGAEGSNFMMDFIKKAKKTFEINPKHPLIQGLLTRVEEAGEDSASENDELKQVVRVLWDTSLVRSGFTVPDTNSYFDQIELLLRKSLGVDEHEKIEVGEIKPAPAVEEGPLDPRAGEKRGSDEDTPVQINSDGSTQKSQQDKQDWAEWSKVKDQLKDKAIKDDQAAQKDKQDSGAGEESKSEDEEEDGDMDDADFDFSKLGDMGDIDMDKMKEMMKDFGGLRDEL